MEDPIKFTRDIKKPHTKDGGRDWETSLFQLHPNGSTILARIEQLPLPDNSFDEIFSYGLFDSDEYDQDKKLMLTEICRVLRKGGVYFVVNLSGHYGSFIDKELKGLPLKEVECSLGNAYKKVE